MFSDIAWMRRLWSERLHDPELTLPAAAKFDNPFQSLGSWWVSRARTDEYMVSLLDAMSADGLSEQIRYENLKGERFSQKRWECLLHMFNHETHHRGQVIQVIDEHGIKNDFPNLIFYVPNRDT